MGRPNVFAQGNKNWFTLFLIAVLILGIAWGSLVEVRAGTIYTTILFFSIVVLVIMALWINEDNKKTTKEYFMTPIESSTLASMGFFVLGWFLIILVNTIGSLFAFSTTSFFGSIYFSGSGLESRIAQTFEAGAIESSPLASFFYSCIVAPITEEFAWAFTLYLLFWAVGIGIKKTFFNGKTPFGLKDKTFYMIIGLIGVTSTFMYVHQLNSSYLGYMFIVAGVFRLLMNLSIYAFGFTLSFTIGVHMANNTFAYIQNYGLGVLLNALVSSGFGWFFMLTFFGIFFYVIKNLGKVLSEMKQEMRT